MKTTDFYRYMQEPSLMKEDTLSEWKDIIDDFPWFQAARILYLKNLAQVEDIRFTQELQRMSVYVPDRKKLFMLIEGDRYGIPHLARTTEDSPQPGADGFSLIDSFLSTYEKKEPEKDSALLFRPSVSSDYIYWTYSSEVVGAEKDEPVPPLQHQSLIDTFIREEEERPAGRRELPEIQESILEEEELENEFESAESLDDTYFTETLARIYVKQKRYDKALQIIKTLSLNYPEKSIYFADQIRFLEKLIINTKK